MAFKNILLLALALVSAKGEKLFDPCNKDDIKCLSTATETFLSKTYGGVEKLGIKPIDPLVIPSIDIVVDDELGFVSKFNNVTVTGLKNLKISDFKMDTAQKSVLLKMQVDFTVAGGLEFSLTKKHKTFSGSYSAKATALGTSNYGYSLKDVNGTNYFEVGLETNTCDIIGEPQVTLGDELQDAIDKDQDAVSLKPEWESKKLACRTKMLCKIVGEGFKTVIHNLRMSAKSLPASYFFEGI